jgi:uncharacterized alkaline shock family protein YloU
VRHDRQATISPDSLARYAGDAAREVEGVHELAGRKGVKIADTDGVVRVEVHLSVEWAASIPEVGAAVRDRVRAYLQQMADVESADVDVVVDEVARA